MSDQFGKICDLFSLLATGHLLGAWGLCKRPWGGYFVFIALKHGADSFLAVSSYGSDTFFHYLEANEKIFTVRKKKQQLQLQLYLSLK